MLLLTLVAAPDPASGHGEPAERTVRQSARRARQHYERGMIHYELLELDSAIGQFREAYLLSRNPSLLFNIAQAYRLKRDRAVALQFYRSYLRLRPDAPNRADVLARIAALEAGGGEASGPERPAGGLSVPTAPEVDATTTSGRPSRARTALRVTGVAALAGGVAMLATGIYFARRASGAADQISAVDRGAGTWSAQLGRLQDDGRSSSARAIGLCIAGGLTSAGGAVLSFLGFRGIGRGEQLVLTPHAGGATVGLVLVR